MRRQGLCGALATARPARRRESRNGPVVTTRTSPTRRLDGRGAGALLRGLVGPRYDATAGLRLRSRTLAITRVIRGVRPGVGEHPLMLLIGRGDPPSVLDCQRGAEPVEPRSALLRVACNRRARAATGQPRERRRSVARLEPQGEPLLELSPRRHVERGEPHDFCVDRFYLYAELSGHNGCRQLHGRVADRGRRHRFADLGTRPSGSASRRRCR